MIGKIRFSLLLWIWLLLLPGVITAAPLTILPVYAPTIAATELSIRLSNCLYRAFNSTGFEMPEKRQVDQTLRDMHLNLASLSRDDLALIALLNETNHILSCQLYQSGRQFRLESQLYNAQRNTSQPLPSLSLSSQMSTLPHVSQKLVTQVFKAMEKKKSPQQDVLAPPQGINLSASIESVNLTWERVPQNHLVTIYRSNDPNGPYQTLTTTDANSYHDEQIQRGKTYHYKLKQQDCAGRKSAASSVFSITTEQGPDSPVIASCQPCCQGVLLQVVPSPLTPLVTLKQVRIYRKKQSGYQWLLNHPMAVDYTNQSTGSQQLVAPISGDNQSAVLVATVLNHKGQESPFSAPTTGTSQDSQVKFEVSDGHLRLNRITISNHDPFIERYHIFRKGTADDKAKLLTTLSVDPFSKRVSYEDKGLADHSTYEYQVLKEDSFGSKCAAPSAPRIGTTKGPPPAPTLFTYRDNQPQKIDFSFHAPADKDIEKIVFCISGGGLPRKRCQDGSFYLGQISFLDLPTGETFTATAWYVNRVGISGPTCEPFEVKTSRMPGAQKL